MINKYALEIWNLTKPLRMFQCRVSLLKVLDSQQAASIVEGNLKTVLGADLHGLHHGWHLVRSAAANIGRQHICAQLHF